MSLSPAQLQTLKTHIANNGDLNEFPNSSDGNAEVANRLNLAASPVFWVWKREVSRSEIHLDPGFDWTRVDNLSAGKARIWDWMFGDGAIDPSQANIRTGIEAVWVGTAADLAVRAIVLAVCRRQATRYEKLFATGTGSTGSPATMGLQGPVSSDEVQAARDLP